MVRSRSLSFSTSEGEALTEENHRPYGAEIVGVNMTNSTEEFLSNYPALFACSRSNPVGVPYWGIECGPGWHPLLKCLCKKAQARVEECGIEQVVFQRVKEKFGALSISFNGGDDYVRGLIDMAVTFSVMTCEACGSRGGLIKTAHGWVKCLCASCKDTLDHQID